MDAQIIRIIRRTEMIVYEVGNITFFDLSRAAFYALCSGQQITQVVIERRKQDEHS